MRAVDIIGMSQRELDKITEADFQKCVTDYVQAQGWKWHHCNSIMRCTGDRQEKRTSGVGFPDLTMVRGGEIVLAELKAEQGKVSRAQWDWIQEYPNIYLWRPSDIGFIMERMR